MLSSATPVTGNTTHTEPENRAYYPALDGVRAIAFLLVFFHHYANMEVGWVGVDIFFVLSGFLITGILFDTRDSLHRVRSFYVRRSLRIFPLYYAVLFVLFVLTPLAHWQWDWRWLSWPLYVGNWVLAVHHGALDDSTTRLMNGWLLGFNGRSVSMGHFWSLCVEEQFYLVWPWVVFYVRSRRALITIAASIVVLWPLVRLLAAHVLPATMITNEITAHNTFFRLDTLMMGALIALLYRGSARQRLQTVAQRSFYVAAGITGVALAAFILHPALLHLRAVKPYLFTIGFSVIAFFSAVLVLRSLLPETLISRLLSNSILRWIGRISYGAYVFHDLPHQLYVQIGQAVHIRPVFVALTGTFLLAWLSFRFFETPFLNLKAKYTVET